MTVAAAIVETAAAVAFETAAAAVVVISAAGGRRSVCSAPAVAGLSDVAALAGHTVAVVAACGVACCAVAGHAGGFGIASVADGVVAGATAAAVGYGRVAASAGAANAATWCATAVVEVHSAAPHGTGRRGVGAASECGTCCGPVVAAAKVAVAVIAVAGPSVVVVTPSVGISAPAVIAIITIVVRAIPGVPVPPGRPPSPAPAKAEAPVGAHTPTVGQHPVAATPAGIVPSVPIGAVPRVPRIVNICPPIARILAAAVFGDGFQLQTGGVLLGRGVLDGAGQFDNDIVGLAGDAVVAIGFRSGRIYSFLRVGIVIFTAFRRLRAQVSDACCK